MQTTKCGDIEPFATDNFILVGPPGGGKSGLAATLPGKTLAICFDVSARTTYQLFKHTNHIELVEYLPGEKDLTPYTMKDMASRPQLSPGQIKESGDMFIKFAQEFNQARRDGFIPGEFQNLIVDSTTTLQDLALNAVMAKNGRAGEVPGIDDYESAKKLISKTFDAAIQLPLNVVFLVHDEIVQVRNTKGEVTAVIRQPLLVGNLKTRLPAKMGHLLRCTAKRGTKNDTRFMLQTKPNAMYDAIRTSFQNLQPDHDVTIEDFSKPFDYGLGKIIKEQKR